MLLDPPAGGELPHERFVQLAPGRIVDGFHAGLGDLELGFLQGAGEALVLPDAPLGLDEQPEALVEGERSEVRLAVLVVPGRGHGAELEGVELLDGGGVKHGGVLLHYW